MATSILKRYHQSLKPHQAFDYTVPAELHVREQSGGLLQKTA